MKQYDKIEYLDTESFSLPVIGFYKHDGSNLRFEWGHKRGWYKYGTRRTMIDRSDIQFGGGIDIFLNKYGDDLDRIFRTKYKRVESFVVFGEYVGENSFAGQHVESDVKDVILFDVNQYRRGIIDPFEFVENFGHLDIPDIVYEGLYTDEFVNNIKSNRLKYGELKEGVVIKGVYKNKNNKDEVIMAKIKTNIWIRQVREKFGEKYLLDELNNDKRLLKTYL